VRAQLYLVALVATARCSKDEPTAASVDVPAARARPTTSSSTTTNEVAPAVPITPAELVADGKHWRLTTKHGPVHVWIPASYKKKGAATIVYVHGFYTHVDNAWRDHHLATQFAVSAVNAMFIACEAPSGGSEPVSWQSIGELLDTVEAGIGMKVRDKRLVAVGHSGAWRTLVGWLDEAALDTVVLFDAAYGEVDKYKDWINGSAKRRLITIGDDTKKWTEQLHAKLPNTLVLDGFPSPDEKVPREVKRAQIVYIRSNVGHFPLVTGGLALPITLRVLRGKLLLDQPLADILDAGSDE